MNRLVPSLPKPGRVLAATALAAVLNAFPIQLIGGGEYAAGSLIAMPLVLVLPIPWAVVVALLAQSGGLLLDPHTVLLLPLAALEAAWLSWSGRAQRSVVLADALFWAVLGLPFGYLVCDQALRLSADSTAVLLISHASTALVAVLFGAFLVRSTSFGEWLGHVQHAPQRLRKLIFSWAFMLTAVPVVALAIGASVLLRRTAAQTHEARLDSAVATVGQALGQHIRLHRAAVVAAARTFERGTPSAVALDEIRRAYPSFVTLLTTDAEGNIRETAPLAPQLRGSSVADRSYFTEPRRTREPFVSGVFRGRGFGRDILIALSAPMRSGDGSFSGVVEGSIEVSRFGTSVSRLGVGPETSIVLVDSSGRVIVAANAEGVQPLERLTHTEFASLKDNVARTIERTNARGVVEVVRAKSMGCEYGVRVIAYRPLLADVGDLLWIYLVLAALVPLLLGGAIWAAMLASRRLSAPLERFAIDAVDQAESGSVSPMATPIEGVPQEIAMVFAAFNCLAARVGEAHSALKKTNEELDARVAERTRELRIAQEKAEAANRSKTEFVAMTGHEIRTPLNALIGLTEVVAQEVPPGKAAERLQTIRRAGVRMLGIVNDLLDLSRVEAGKLELRNEPVEVGAVGRDLVALFGAEARRLGLVLELDLQAESSLWVQTDAPRLQQVLANLLGNALKFTKRGGVTLQIKCEAATEREVTLRLAVIDTGPGIKPEEQARLFQPYVQLPGAAGASVVGTGLGLAISRRLARLFGGELTVRSEPGRGSEFHFTANFRRVAPPAPPATPAPPAAPAASAVSVAAKGSSELRVLVVDDNVANQEVLRAFVERSCKVVECAGSAREGLDWLQRERFDVALVDLEMPDETGDVVVRRMAEGGAKTPSADCVLVAVSAHTRDEKRAECIALGFDDFLPKPVDRQELFRMLERIAARRAAATR